MRAELSRLVNDDGKTREQIVQYYIAKYGSQEPLASPIDTGFNRLAWAVPYVLGAGGLVGVGLVAVRWSRRSGANHDRNPPSRRTPNPTDARYRSAPRR